MTRSVVLGKTPRCERCHFPPRWCICDAFEAVECPLPISVLIHHREYWRPSSTGRLIDRIMPNARTHVYRHDLPLAPSVLCNPDRPLWILHPLGEPLATKKAPPNLQILLLDGSWREASKMSRAVDGWGERVGLPIAGPSRYWLRGQQGAGNFSTIEALLFLLGYLGFDHERKELQEQFELHVYAGLRVRGDKNAAEKYLQESPIRQAFPELLMKLSEKRGRTA